ncbi:MAG: peptide chain release factor N(5)-glutamine methyltransferase [Spirochaetales bacterium]|nr:peptide chain release factor N(5)-glutamine methyltransferase [Spirochaetales bacterium]
MTAADAVEQLTARLSVPFIESPQTEARLIMCHIMQWDSRSYILNKNSTIVQDIFDQAISMAEQRLVGRSLAAILGSQPFCEDTFAVNDDVLIPRPETELLVEHILANHSDSPINVLEIGVGSGIITISLAKHRPLWTFTAIDISEAAIRTARQNADIILKNTHNCAINIIHQDFFLYSTPETFDIIVSNPPYIPSAETTRLLESKTISDPRIALDGGQDGLDFYRRILTFAETHLRPNGIIAVEHAFDQRQALSELAASSGYEYRCYQDYAGLDRYSEMKRL